MVVPPPDDVRAAVRRQLALATVREFRRLQPAQVPGVLLIAASLRGRLPAVVIGAWLTIVALDAVRARVHLRRSEERLEAGLPAESWERAARPHAFSFGAARGSLAVFALWSGDAGAMNVALIVMMAIAALSVGTTAFRSIYVATVVGLGVPTLGAAMALGGSPRLVGLLGLMFVPLMITIQARLASALAGAAEAEHVNRALTAQLAAEHRHLAAANDQLTAFNAQLTHRATHDPLTGLANRSLALEALGEAVLTAAPGALLAVLYGDLDGFKPINDTLGHQVGDHVLIAVARRLAGAVTGDDVVARLGGDEFLVVVRDLPTADHAVAIAERLRAAVSVPVAVDGQTVTVGVSIGVATVSRPCVAGDLLAAADGALYRAKQAGRNRVEAVAHAADRGLVDGHRNPGTGVATARTGGTGYTLGTPSGNR